MALLRRGLTPRCVLGLAAALVLVFAGNGSESKRAPGCPPGCNCTSETVICVGSSVLPRTVPPEITSLSVVNGTFPEIKEAAFALMPSLHLLLLNSNTITCIKDEAFSGLPRLEYLFIEGNKIEEIGKGAFRGLRDVTHLSLANNNLKALPKGLFSDLHSLMELDLRGNVFQCDCPSVWLMLWLRKTNASVPDARCAEPAGMRGVLLRDFPEKHGSCATTDFVLHQTVNTQSMSGDIFTYREDIYAALAVPNSDSCVIMEWDHIEANFRPFDNITGRSVIGCRSVLMDRQAYVIVAQLSEGSRVYRFDPERNQFTKFQNVETPNVSKPNDVEAFGVGDERFLLIVDSSKAGVSTLFRWNQSGFFPHQLLREWFRDSDAEFLLDPDGVPALVVASRSQAPVVYRWNAGTRRFVRFAEIPGADDTISVKAFRIHRVLYLALACYIGDSRVLRWTGAQFEEVQGFPSRGTMVLQPFSFGRQHYLVLSSDYTFSRILRWDEEQQTFAKFREVFVQWPRSFTPFSAGGRDFLLASSFKGKTKVFKHVSVDYV